MPSKAYASKAKTLAAIQQARQQVTSLLLPWLHMAKIAKFHIPSISKEEVLDLVAAEQLSRMWSELRPLVNEAWDSSSDVSEWLTRAQVQINRKRNSIVVSKLHYPNWHRAVVEHADGFLDDVRIAGKLWSSRDSVPSAADFQRVYPKLIQDSWPYCIVYERVNLWRTMLEVECHQASAIWDASPRTDDDEIPDGETPQTLDVYRNGLDFIPSEYAPPSHWASKWGLSTKTWVKRCTAGRIRHRKENDKSYQVDIRDIPHAQINGSENGQVEKDGSRK